MEIGMFPKLSKTPKTSWLSVSALVVWSHFLFQHFYLWRKCNVTTQCLMLLSLQHFYNIVWSSRQLIRSIFWIVYTNSWYVMAFWILVQFLYFLWIRPGPLNFVFIMTTPTPPATPSDELLVLNEFLMRLVL